jgi:CDP-diacylglycerol--glycerol-3-phosphate 3-phosphatidyltransferase
MKYIVSLITTGRIAGALVLLFIEPLSIPFFVVYILCCASDVIDGYVARKTNTASRFGEILDSAADFVLIAVMLVIFIPLLVWERWMLYWIGAIAAVRFVSLAIGFAKYRALAFLHTYGNKATGIACACFPILNQLLGLSLTLVIICAVASLSAFEELSITISAKELNRNRKSVFENGSGQ